MNGFIIIDRHQQTRPVGALEDHIVERLKQAKIMAGMRVGDRETLILHFMNKLASTTCSDAQLVEKLSFSIRSEQPLDLHNGKSLDLEKMMHLL